MLSILRRGAATGLVALAMTLAAGNAMAAWDALNLPVGVTPISRDVYDLHMLVLWICVIIGTIVFGAMLVSIVLHRKAAGHKPAQFHHSTFAEIVWTVIPSVILLGLAIPATKTLIDMEDTSEAELTLKVTAYQWLWKYEYVEDGVSFYSSLAPSSRAAIYGDPWQVDNYLLEVDNPVVLPVGKKVRILLTADDVIHAWWMPALGVKKDAIPGFINEMWVIIEEPGTYRGQCAELCGKDHGFMPIVVEAKSDDEYKQWVAAYKTEQQTQLAATTIPSQ
jgi:cytochrome c oxidase subunit 2